MNDCKAEKEIVKTAKGMLSGDIQIIIGCRIIKSLRHQTDRPDDEIFTPFIGIDSQTDHYPLGNVRDLCDPNYLARVDKEMEEFLCFASECIREACCDLIKKLNNKDYFAG